MKRNIKIVLILILVVGISGIPIWNRIFFLNVNITKDYKIKQVPFTNCYWLCDKNRYVVRGISSWVIDKKYIHGYLKNLKYRYFIYNNETHETFYFTKGEKAKYENFLIEKFIRNGMSMYDDIGNYIFNRHNHLYVNEQEEFKKLSPEMKIEKIIETCAGKYKAGLGPKFYDYLDLSTDEVEKAIAPILLEKLNNSDIKPRATAFNKTEYDIIYRLCIINRFFTPENKKKLVSILEKKLDTYLKEYKIVDGYVVELDYRISLLSGVKSITHEYSPPDENLLKKYTEMGYKDLKIQKFGEE